MPNKILLKKMAQKKTEVKDPTIEQIHRRCFSFSSHILISLFAMGSSEASSFFRKWVAEQVSSGWEGSDDQHILVAFSKTRNGKDWWPPRRLPIETVTEGAALWSPVLHADKYGTLWLFFCEAKSCVREARGQVPRRWAPGGDIRATSTRTGEHSWCWIPGELVKNESTRKTIISKKYTYTNPWIHIYDFGKGSVGPNLEHYSARMHTVACRK